MELFDHKGRRTYAHIKGAKCLDKKTDCVALVKVGLLI